MDDFKEYIFEDDYLTELYLNFNSVYFENNNFIFESKFSIAYEKAIIYIDDEILKAFSSLTETNIDVLRKRLVDQKTLQEVGSEFNLTRERIRQIESSNVKRFFASINHNVLIDIYSKVKEQGLLNCADIHIQDNDLKLILLGLLSHKQSKNRLIYDKDLMILTFSREYTFNAILSKIESSLIHTTDLLFSMDELHQLVGSAFPKLFNIQVLVEKLEKKMIIKKLPNNHYFFISLYKSQKQMLEFLFSLHPEGLELHKNVDVIKDELDVYFPGCFTEKDTKRKIATSAGNSDSIVLWDWGKHIHIKYVEAILDEYDFTNILTYIDSNLQETQISLETCFEIHLSELKNIGITNKYALHTCLKLKYPDEYSYQDSPWISQAGTERRSLGQTLNNLMAEDRVYTLDELTLTMHTTDIRVQQLIDHTNDIISVASFQYKHIKYVEVPKELLLKIISYANSKVLSLEFFYIDLIIEAFKTDLKIYNHYNISTLILELLKKSSESKNFNITNTRIVHKDYPITKDSLNFHVLIKNLLKIKSSISINDISKYFIRRGLSTSSIMAYFIGSRIKQIARLEKSLFLSISDIGLSQKDLENINLLVKNSIEKEENIDDLIETLSLPNISVEWNRLLLTDILYNNDYIFSPSRENPMYIKRRED